MSRMKRFFGQVPLLILWLMFSLLLWGSVFVRITDTAPAKKLVVCVDAEVPGAAELARLLEAQAGKTIRMVKVRPFTYAMFDADSLTKADIFILRAENFERYADWFLPLPEEMNAPDALVIDGVAWGLPLNGAAAAYIDYWETDGWYLFFGAQSLHVDGNAGAVDNEAVAAATAIMNNEQ